MPIVDKAILVLLSGGLDSTYVLYKYLKETNLPVHAHHISLRTVREERWKVEDVCVENILEHCKQYRSFSYSSTTYQFNLPYSGWDSDIQVTVAARVAANLDAETVVVALGINADDLEREEIIERNERNVIHDMWTIMRGSIDEPMRSRLHPELHLPFKDVRKWQMIDEMPEELVAMTWSCRSPVYTEDGNGAMPCGKCHACAARIKASWELKKQREMRRTHSDESEVVDAGIRIPMPELDSD